MEAIFTFSDAWGVSDIWVRMLDFAWFKTNYICKDNSPRDMSVWLDDLKFFIKPKGKYDFIRSC